MTRVAFLSGVAGAGLLFLGLGEVFLRAFPSDDLLPYLGEACTERPCFTTDGDLPFRFRSFQDFADDNPHWWRRQLRKSTHGDDWLFLGNSFAFNLKTHLRKHESFKHLTISTLDRREPLLVRLAQLQALLESNHAPEHVFLVITEVDLLRIGEQPLVTQELNSQGALTFRPRLPPQPLGWLADHSRLAFAAWARTGNHRGDPHFRRRHMSDQLAPHLRDDVEQLVAGLGKVCQRHATPVTVIVIPMRDEVCRNTVFPIEDALVPCLRAAGILVVDPRPAFTAERNPARLYVPDGHLSRRGNDLVADTLRQTLAAALITHTVESR
jgi:hypothetical protein